MKTSPEELREGYRTIAGLLCQVWANPHPYIELVVHNKHKGQTNYESWGIEEV